MKRALFIALILTSCLTFAQTDFGLRAGLNYNSNGDIETDFRNTTTEPTAVVGYHIGLYGRTFLSDKLFLKPELVFTKTKSDYEGDDFDMSKVDLPILVGYTILRPLYVFGGPALQYILATDLDGVTLEDVENNFTVGLTFGAGVQFRNFGFDIRYERGILENEAEFVGLNSGKIDTRPRQLIFSLSVKF